MKKLIAGLILAVASVCGSRAQTFNNVTLNGTLTINASSITGSAYFPPAMMGQGIPSSSTVLFGDGVWRASTQTIPSQTGLAGYYLSTNGTSLVWATALAGPSSTTLNGIPTFSNTGGTAVQNTPATVDTSGNAVFPGTFKLSAFTTAGILTNNGTGVLSTQVPGATLLGYLGTGSPSSTNYLRGDGTWATPAGVPAGSSTQVQFNSGSGFGASPYFIWSGNYLQLGLGDTANTAQTLIVDGGSGTGTSFGAQILAGTNASDYGLFVADSGGSNQMFVVEGTGQIKMPKFYSSAGYLKVDGSGNMTSTTTLSGSSLSLSFSANASTISFSDQNNSTGIAAVNEWYLANASNGLEFAMTGASYSGSFLSGAPAGTAAYIFTPFAQPIVLGTNNLPNLTILSGGAATFSSTLTIAGNSLTFAGGSSLTDNGSGQLTLNVPSTKQFIYTVNGSNLASIDQNGNFKGNTTQMGNGSATNPAFVYAGATTTGTYNASPGIGFAVGAASVGTWTTTTLNITGGSTLTGSITVGNGQRIQNAGGTGYALFNSTSTVLGSNSAATLTLDNSNGGTFAGSLAVITTSALNGNVTVGVGGSGTVQPNFVVNGSSNAGGFGPVLALQLNGTSYGQITNDGVILGSAASNLAIRALSTNNIVFYQATTLLGSITSTGLNGMAIGATTASTGVFTSGTISNATYNALLLNRTSGTNSIQFQTAGTTIGFIDAGAGNGINLYNAGGVSIANFQGTTLTLPNTNSFSVGGTSTLTGTTFAGAATNLSAPSKLVVKGSGIAFNNDLNGSNNNYSTISNTDTGSNSNLVFTTGGGVTLSLDTLQNATFAGQIKTSLTSAVFSASGATTSSRYLSIGNTGDTASIGVESSVGGIIITGSTGYALALSTSGAVPIQFGYNSVLQLTLGNGVATFTGSVLSSSATGGIGYSTGSGTAQVQATSRSTGVTANTVNGQITGNGASLAASTSVTFTVTDSACAATDGVELDLVSGGVATTFYRVSTIAAGSFQVTEFNTNTLTADTTAPVFKFIIHKGANS